MSNGNGPESEPATDPNLASLADPLRGRTVALCVTGSVAAYKAVELARLLVKAGATVLPVMTASALHFLGPLTLAGICGQPVATNMWDPTFAGEMHVAIANRADLVAIVPATADVLARLAQGRADDLVTALALSAKGPVLVAPAMHPRMWDHPATQRNVATLAALGRVTLVGPVRGAVASGDEGMGRMAEPAAIAAAAAALVEPSASSSGPNSGESTPGPSSSLEAHRPELGARADDRPESARRGDLQGLRVLVTAGPTLEDIDPVRFLGNRSSGKMGFAIAARAAMRGAQVTLIAGPVALATPPGVRRVDVRGALDMRAALWQVLKADLSGTDALIMAAAVADHRPAQTSTKKLKKGEAKAVLELVKNPDLLSEIGAARSSLAAGPTPGTNAADPGGGRRRKRAATPASSRPARPVLVGFAVETGTDDAVVAYARQKLEAKRVDLIVCNEAKDSFGRDDNRIGLVTASERGKEAKEKSGAAIAPATTRGGAVEFLPAASKEALAEVILSRVRALL